MQDSKKTIPDDEPFDLAQWAERRGICCDRPQANESTELLAEIEAALAAERRARAEVVIDHITKFGRKTDVSTNELMAMTRDDA